MVPDASEKQDQVRHGMRCVLATIVALAVVSRPAWAGEVSSEGATSGEASPRAAKLRSVMTLVPPPEVSGATWVKRPASCDGEEPPRGIAMILTGVGLAVPTATFSILLGSFMRSLSNACFEGCEGVDEPPDPSAGVGMFVFGGAAFVAGITMIAVGVARIERWRDWKARQQVFLPTMGRTAFGTWTPGLALRF